MAAQKSANLRRQKKRIAWLVTTQGVDKSAYDLHKNEKVSCSAFQGKTA